MITCRATPVFGKKRCQEPFPKPSGVSAGPNTGTENVLTGRIFQNTATTVTVQDGVPENTATVRQFNNDPYL